VSALALFGHGAMSDLSPLCASKRTSVNVSRLSVYARTNPHCLIAVAHEVFRAAQPVLNALGALTRPPAPYLRQNNPTGKFSLSPSGKSLLGLPPSCPRGRGVGHRHRTLGWDAVDAAVSGVKFVRRAVFVSGRRRAGRTMPKRTVKSCGSDASVVGVKSAEGKSVRPGADEPAIRRRRRQQSPILQEREVSRKAIAQGMPECLR
jgi:hypothetical protein